MTAARALGVGMALDDFGTGCSSLSHLRNFDFELLKLDSTYVSGPGERCTDKAIVRHVASPARSLGIATVAEGVQDAGQVERLLELGGELGQGCFFSEPQPPTIIAGLLAGQSDGGRSPATPLATPVSAPSEPAAVVLPKLRRTTPVAPR